MASDNLVWRWVGDDTLVLLDLETGLYHSLNWTAGVVWLLLSRGRTVSQVVIELQELTKDVDREQVCQDVQELAERFKQMSLLVENKDTVDTSSEIEEDKGFPFMPSDDRNYQKPSVRKHEALQKVTAGTYSSGGYSYYYTYYYYYYYYY